MSSCNIGLIKDVGVIIIRVIIVGVRNKNKRNGTQMRLIIRIVTDKRNINGTG